MDPIPITQQEYDRFTAAFHHYAAKFGLTDYEFVIEWEELDGAWATVERDVENRLALVKFTTTRDPSDAAFNPERHAFHEACHVLLGHLSHIGRQRWTTEREIDEAEEALVRKLETAFFPHLPNPNLE